MDCAAVRAAYDEQVRRRAHPAGALGRRAHPAAERDGRVVREVREQWAGVTWSDLDERTADAAIAAQLERFADRNGRWEWKLYSYDRPADLPARLRAAGLRAEEEEALLVAEIAELDLDTAIPAGVELVEPREQAAVRALVAFQDEIFGSGHPGMAEELIAALARSPPEAVAVMAVAEGRPAAAGRVELPAGGEFAGLWGGCTDPVWRGRGLFRALVARRAAVAAQRGYRWLHVDASAQSRPILMRLGFIELAKTTPYLYSP